MKYIAKLWALLTSLLISAPSYERVTFPCVKDGDFRVRDAQCESKAVAFRRFCASRRFRKSKPIERRRRRGSTPTRHDGFTLGRQGRRYGATR